MSEMTESEKQLVVELTTQVEEFGFAAIGVFPTADSALQYWFTYTLGRADQGLSELIVTGVRAEAAHAIIGQVVADMEHQMILPGVPWQMDGGSMAVLAPVPDSIRDAHATYAGFFASTDDWELLQVLWTDDEDRWPWDDGHLRTSGEPGYREALPLFAGDDWRPNG